MAADVAIRAEGLGKKYIIGHEAQREKYVALRDVLARTARNAWRTTLDLARGRAMVVGDTIEDFWALKDLNFEIKRGEIVGIIGRNGAGKTTLLKILSRITDPTEGRITIDGRVASLLEVGTGFHPELTGRENIYLNGAILGMARVEIRRKFDEIVTFAQVERFLDTPVKRYSSGMYVRLAFAVAAHLEPEILIVDEVLAVGDAEFQKKCLGKMSEVAGGGRTVLFVSHNLGAVTSLCSSAVWLDRGTIKFRGDTRSAIDGYLAQELLSRNRVVYLDHLQRKDGRILLKSLEWLSETPLQHGQPFVARLRFETRAPLNDVSIGIGFSALEGRRLLSYDTDFQDGVRPSITHSGDYWVDVKVESLPLGPDIYNLDIGCRSGDFHSLAYIPACIQLEIVAGPTTPGTIVRKDSGVRLPSAWSWNIADKRPHRTQEHLSASSARK